MRQTFSGDPVARQTEVKERLALIFNAAETRDLDRLDSYHWYGPHFTKFTSSARNRLDAAAAREGEHKAFSTLVDLKLRADDVQIDLFGDTAVTTLITTASYKSGRDTVIKRERGTIIFVKHDGSWKIVHEHFSAIE
jgi:ketosteroid isomerase-like protein